MDVYDFIGQYKMTQGSRDLDVGDRTLRKFVDVGDKLYIGTGTHNDPILQNDGTLGVTIWNQDGQKFPENNGVALFSYETGRLSFTGTYDGLPLSFVISLYRASVTGGLYKAPYGVVTWGDPDQVGAWGAEDDVDEGGGGGGGPQP